MAKSGKQTQPDGLKEEGEGIPGGRKERHWASSPPRVGSLQPKVVKDKKKGHPTLVAKSKLN
jgi:hypothetical protein